MKVNFFSLHKGNSDILYKIVIRYKIFVKRYNSLDDKNTINKERHNN